MFPPVDTKSPAAVAAFVTGKFRRMFPGVSPSWLKQLFRDTEDLFTGRHPDFAQCDTRYHDFEHTLQGTVCLALILEGRAIAGVEPKLTARQFKMAIAAILLHDSGYLRVRSDRSGTGAKYTYCHVLRSCGFAASYLPTLGANDYEVEAVLGAINCTGPTKQVSRLYFREPVERIVGCALATADYLGQLSAPDYPDELEILYQEFKESDDYIHLPPSRRPFKSAADLIAKTPDFWRTCVLPKLESDYQAMYRFLAVPYPQGPNLYLEAVEKNIAKVERRIAGKKGKKRS